MDSDPNGSGSDWAAPGSAAPPPGWSTEQPPPAPAQSPQQWGPQWGYPAPPPPRPGIVPLRPLGVGELLDGAFTAIRRYPGATLGLAACVMLVVTAAQVLTEWYVLQDIDEPAPGAPLSDATDYLARVGTAGILSTVITLVGTLLLTGLITAVIGEGVLGRPVTVGDAWQRVRPLVWRLIGVTFLTFLLTWAVFVPGILFLFLGATAFAVLLLLAAIPFAAYIWISLALAPAALVLERQSVRGALRRSRALVKGSWWRVLGILLLAGIIASVVGGIISLPFSFAGGGLTSIGDDRGPVEFADLVIAGLGGLIASTIVRPFSAGVGALLYIDRRMRAEALDLTLMRAAAEG